LTERLRTLVKEEIERCREELKNG